MLPEQVPLLHGRCHCIAWHVSGVRENIYFRDMSRWSTFLLEWNLLTLKSVKDGVVHTTTAWKTNYASTTTIFEMLSHRVWPSSIAPLENLKLEKRFSFWHHPEVSLRLVSYPSITTLSTLNQSPVVKPTLTGLMETLLREIKIGASLSPIQTLHSWAVVTATATSGGLIGGQIRWIMRMRRLYTCSCSTKCSGIISICD